MFWWCWRAVWNCFVCRDSVFCASWDRIVEAAEAQKYCSVVGCVAQWEEADFGVWILWPGFKEILRLSEWSYRAKGTEISPLCHPSDLSATTVCSWFFLDNSELSWLFSKLCVSLGIMSRVQRLRKWSGLFIQYKDAKLSASDQCTMLLVTETMCLREQIASVLASSWSIAYWHSTLCSA